MASALKAAVGKTAEKVSGTDSDDSEDIKAAMGKYLLKITAGPSYDLSTHSPVFVNTDTPTLIESDLITAKIKVRIRGYEGLPRGSKNHSPYFEDPAHTSDQWSIGFSFIPKHDIVASDTRYGADFDHPVRDRLPPKTLIDLGTKIFKTWIDPGADMDPYGDEPYLLGPTLSTWYILRIGEKIPADQHRDHDHPHESSPVTEGADGDSATKIREEYKMPSAPLKRRKHFLSAKNSEGFVYEKDRLYTGDFHNPYIDFQQFKVKLPGLSIGVARYINDKTHVLRWVFKNIKTKELYFVVCFTLLHGDDVDIGLREDRQRRDGERQGSVAASTNGSAEVENRSHPGSTGKKPELENEEAQRSPPVSGEQAERPTEAATDKRQLSKRSDDERSKPDAAPTTYLPVRTKPQEPSQEPPQTVQEKAEPVEMKQDDLIQHATGTYKPGSAIADTNVGKEMLER